MGFLLEMLDSLQLEEEEAGDDEFELKFAVEGGGDGADGTDVDVENAGEDAFEEVGFDHDHVGLGRGVGEGEGNVKVENLFEIGGLAVVKMLDQAFCNLESSFADIWDYRDGVPYPSSRVLLSWSK